MRDKDGEVLFAGYLHQEIASDVLRLMQAFFRSLNPILFIQLEFFDEEEGLVALPAGNIRKTDKPERAFGKALLTAKDINISFFRYVYLKRRTFRIEGFGYVLQKSLGSYSEAWHWRQRRPLEEVHQGELDRTSAPTSRRSGASIASAGELYNAVYRYACRAPTWSRIL